MAWLTHRHLVHLLSAYGFICTQEESVGHSVKEALGAACSEYDTVTTLLAPTHFVKVDQCILPVMDYLCINPAEESGVLILLNLRGFSRGKQLYCQCCPEEITSLTQ